VIPSLARIRQRAKLVGAAREYAAAGWPVAPGAWWDAAESRYRCAQPGCVTQGLHPTVPDIDSVLRRCMVSVGHAAVTDPGLVACRWGRRPFAVLMPTGQVADVLELAPSIAPRVVAASPPGPVATLPDGRVLLFTEVGTAPDPELVGPAALHHSQGSWVPLPPSRLATGRVTWLRSPRVAGWQLPNLRDLRVALHAALSTVSRADRR
jgi:hypothetical protein